MMQYSWHETAMFQRRCVWVLSEFLELLDSTREPLMDAQAFGKYDVIFVVRGSDVPLSADRSVLNLFCSQGTD
jgi:hypothetical protein